MKRMPITKNALRISSAAALCALIAVPAACSSDSSPINGQPEAGTGGETGSGGAKGSGGSKSTGGHSGSTVDASTGGTVGAGGSTDAGTGGSSKGGADTGAGGGTTTLDSGAPDAEVDSGPPPCAAPEKPSDARICLTWDPEVINATADPRMNLQGTMIVAIYDTDNPGPTTVPLFSTIYPPLDSMGKPVDTDLATLPEIDANIAHTDPDAGGRTVYLRALFVDNAQWFLNKTVLTYGMFVGGFDLTQGVNPPPKLRPITLTTGKGVLHSTHLTAFKRFTTKVGLADTVIPADDAQGPISVGAFNVSAPSMQPVLGGVQLPCTDLKKGPVDVTGFLYGTGDFWIVAQLDDFNKGGLSMPGSIVSLGGGANFQSALPSQKVTVAAGDYAAADIPLISLNVVVPGSTGFAPYACPVTP